MSLATASAIRDRLYTLVEAITPTSLSRDTFRRYRNEDGADFTAWAEKNPAGALRRFQVRQVGDEDVPLVSNTLEERVRVAFEARLAYPQTARYGRENAMDRDDVMNDDWIKINYAIGIYGRSNFSGSYDCTPLGATKSRDSSGPIDFLVIRVEFEYTRSTS